MFWGLLIGMLIGVYAILIIFLVVIAQEMGMSVMELIEMLKEKDKDNEE